MNLTEALDTAAFRWPEKAKLIEGKAMVSFSGLVAKAVQFASQFQWVKLFPDCRVGLSFPTRIDYVSLTFALWQMPRTKGKILEEIETHFEGK